MLSFDSEKIGKFGGKNKKIPKKSKKFKLNFSKNGVKIKRNRNIPASSPPQKNSGNRVQCSEIFSRNIQPFCAKKVIFVHMRKHIRLILLRISRIVKKSAEMFNTRVLPKVMFN